MMIAGSNAPVDGSSIKVKVFALGAPTGLEADATAFLVKADGKVASDDDMIFYGQPRSKGDVVTHASSQGVDEFSLDLARLPAAIEKIAFTLTIHEATQRQQSFANLSGARIELVGTGLEFAIATSGRPEAAMIMGELYRRNGQWKFRAVGQGFNGGLQPLAESFGVKVDSAPTPAPAPASVVDLRKKKTVDLKKRDPELGRSAEVALVSLEKKGQAGLRAKVALVLDISVSMRPLYKRGSMDDLVRRLVALGFQVDDDGDIDVFLFGQKAYYYGSVQEGNYKSFTADMQAQYSLEGGTKYGEAMELVRSHYWGGRNDGLAVYCLFVTDGGTQDPRKSETQIIEASSEPIFWQFVAIGDHPGAALNFNSKRLPQGFDLLEHLDKMPGRKVDNANFFAVADPSTIEDTALYDKMFEEFPDWLKAAKAHGILS